MKKQITTATLPPAMREHYEIIGAIPGGPVVALPQYGMDRVDFSQLLPQEAERLIALRFPHIRRLEAKRGEIPPPPPPPPADRVHWSAPKKKRK